MTVEGFTWRERSGVRVLVPDFFGALGLSGGFSTRASDSGRDLDFDLRGVKPHDEILENRRLVAEAMGVDASRLVLAEQVHGAAAALVAAKDAGRGAVSAEEVIPGVDALVTTEPSVPLAVLSADCVLLVLADEKRRAAAAVHAGWRGALAGVATVAVGEMCALGVERESLYAAIGPAIEQYSYEVGDEVAAKFQSRFAWGAQVLTISEGKAHLDLPGAVKLQLIKAGVRLENIFDCGLCTFCRNDLFYSYRKEGSRAGRIAGVISIDD